MTTEAHSTADPSHTVGATLPPPDELLEQAMAAVVPILELEDEATAVEAAQAYIRQRVAELSPTDNKVDRGIGAGTDTFISDRTALSLTGLMSKSYYLDDPTAYDTAFAPMRTRYHEITGQRSPEKAYVTAVLSGVNVGQANYFGSIAGDQSQRVIASADFIGDDDGSYGMSIAGFGTSAMCNERAAVAHNGLLIFGIASRLEQGKLGVRQPDGNPEMGSHAFITVDLPDGAPYLYDPTNPILTYDEAGEVVDMRPALFRLNTDEAGRQAVDLPVFTMAGGERQQTGFYPLVYELGSVA